MSQSRRLSLVESIMNVVIGYAIAIVSQTVIFPRFGIMIPFSDHLKIGLFFTIISLLRSYVLRRIFNRVR
jgi:hypothetical protein